ncbi:hypothetical protein JHK82_044664 [Glycine max]|nr:hypothetical protein JHK87_044854 [Glycine soja]KAG5099612.1 hypothetical protein JHK82_044664 [Glycine max]
MRCGKTEKLWDGVMNLKNLKEVDLSWSLDLKKLPDLSKATNLKKLDKLDLSSCMSLTVLVSNSHSCSLSCLNLDDCKNLKEFSLISKNMKELRLGFTPVKALPSSFELQSKVELLHLPPCWASFSACPLSVSIQ